MTATAYCTSNSVFYQVQLATTAKSQLAPILCITSLSSSSSSLSVSHSEQQIRTKETVLSDENNNQSPSKTTISGNKRSTIVDSDQTLKEIDEVEFLAGVGLRLKTKKPSSSAQLLRPLTKRLAVPVCFLPLKNNGGRVRHALSIVLPYLKFLSVIHDAEQFCSTQDVPDFRSSQLLALSHKRSSAMAANRKMGKHKLSKADFITLAADTYRNEEADSSMNKYVDAALHCHVALDRLDAVTIDQLMKDVAGDDVSTSSRDRLVRDSSGPSKAVVPRARRSLNLATTETTTARTVITTLTTEKTTVKQKSTTDSFNPAKRLKTSHEDDTSVSHPKSSTLSYERIYLKCFICSKREFIDAQVTNSDKLHSHWLAHDHELSLNIYDSEIDSILTRVVEFFHFPKRHSLEGNIQTVFILNSEEVRKTRALPPSDDTCIVLD